MRFRCRNCDDPKELHAEDGCYRYGCRCDNYDPPAEDVAAQVWTRYHTGEWLLGGAM